MVRFCSVGDTFDGTAGSCLHRVEAPSYEEGVTVRTGDETFSWGDEK